jgi:hypothetical protein
MSLLSEVLFNHVPFFSGEVIQAGNGGRVQVETPG